MSAILQWTERLRWLIVGVLLATAVAILGAFIYGKAGGEYMGADIKPNYIEAEIANMVMDSSVGHFARHQANPYPISDENLSTGAREYEEHCALCHGGLLEKKSPLQHSVYPGAPQFVAKELGKSGGGGLDMPDWHMHYVIRHGIRWTAMPSWSGVLHDDEIWKVVMFLDNMGNLPPKAMQVWREAAQQHSSVPEQGHEQ